MKNSSKQIIQLPRYAIAILAFGMVLAALSCKKESGSDAGDENVLIEANNNKALGQYTGLIFEPAGSYRLQLRKSGSKATLVYNGTTHVLDGQGAVEENAAITNYVFQKSDIKINFSVGADGKTPRVTMVIPGSSNVRATVSKETTTYQTISYSGKIRDSLNRKDWDPAGITVSNNIVSGFAKVDTQYVSISGQRVDTSSNVRISFSNQPGRTYPATISGDRVSGGSDYVFNLNKVN